MSRIMITSLIALGIGMAATSGDAAVGPTGDRAQAAVGTVQFAQAGNNARVRGPVRTAPRGSVVVPRGVAPRVVGPGFVPRSNVGVPRVIGQPGIVRRPVGIGGPVGIGRPAFVGRPAYVGRSAFVRGYRPFYRRPWFGTVIGGVALGTFLTVAAVGIAPDYPPAPGLCWFWADPSLTAGYWDYCEPPY